MVNKIFFWVGVIGIASSDQIGVSWGHNQDYRSESFCAGLGEEVLFVIMGNLHVRLWGFKVSD